MKIAVIVKPNNGCDFYRCVLPIEYFPFTDFDQVKMFLPETTPLDESQKVNVDYISTINEFEPDIIFYNRDVSLRTIEFIQEQKAKGVKIVLDLDDYWEISTAHPVYQMWYKDKMNERVIENILEADLVLVTTEILRKRVLEYNKNCIVTPNAVPFGTPFWTKDNNIERVDSKMNFLYAGGSTHYNDILLLKNTFTKLGGEKYITDNAKFTLAGFNPLPDKHCEWDKMASIFSRTKSYQILDTRPLQQHMTFYDEADVALIPLVNNEFNRYKSELKILEAATRELPCIVSDTLPYSNLKGFPGLFWDNWQKNIKYCLKNQKEVVSLGKELAERVKEKFDIKIWSAQRYEIFKHLIK